MFSQAHQQSISDEVHKLRSDMESVLSSFVSRLHHQTAEQVDAIVQKTSCAESQLGLRLLSIEQHNGFIDGRGSFFFLILL